MCLTSRMSVPKIISVDDHVLEPGDLWVRYLPAHLRDRAPRLVRIKGRFEPGARGGWVADDTGDWADIWQFEGYEMAIIPGFAAAGMDQDYLGEHWEPLTYDEIRPGCFEPEGPARRHGRQPHRGVDLLPDRSRASAARPSTSAPTRSSRWPACRPTTTG